MALSSSHSMSSSSCKKPSHQSEFIPQKTSTQKPWPITKYNFMNANGISFASDLLKSATLSANCSPKIGLT
jgi:hypothetical protein